MGPDVLTPEMIKAMVEAGEISLADLQLLHPEEKKIALPLLLNHPFGSMEGEMGQALSPSFGGIKFGGKPGVPSGASGSPSKPANLQRQGNLSNPGEGGTGSPSTPSKGAKIDWHDTNRSTKPLDPTNGDRWKGPMGDDANYRTVSKPPTKSVGADLKNEHRAELQKHLPERRTGPSSGPPDGVSERRYAELLDRFGGKNRELPPGLSQAEQNQWGAMKRKLGLTDKDLPAMGPLSSPKHEGATVDQLWAALKEVMKAHK